MPNVFYDTIIDFKQYDIDINGNIFNQILEARKKELDKDRFFLNYISAEDLSKYDFNNKESLNEFRDICCTYMKPIKYMGGCNLRPEMQEKGLRDSGIVISDPNKNVLGQFNVRDDSVIYSPFFPLFYEERDVVKFANDEYFTTISFEELVMNQINYANKFYVHIGNPKSQKEYNQYGQYIMEEINKDQMINYLLNPEQGEKVLKKYLTR